MGTFMLLSKPGYNLWDFFYLLNLSCPLVSEKILPIAVSAFELTVFAPEA